MYLYNTGLEIIILFSYMWPYFPRFFEIFASTYDQGPYGPGPYAPGPLKIWKNILGQLCSRSI